VVSSSTGDAAAAVEAVNSNIHVRHSSARENADVLTATEVSNFHLPIYCLSLKHPQEPVPVNHRGLAAPRDIASQSKCVHAVWICKRTLTWFARVAPALAKTLKHVPSVMSLSAKNKVGVTMWTCREHSLTPTLVE